MNNKLTNDKIYLQRVLRLAGYYTGKIDGIAGKLTQNAIARWDQEEQEARALYGTFDERTENNLTTIIPAAQKSFRKWFAAFVQTAKNKGYVAKVICGTRTYAEQNALYAQGRTTRGAKVTNAKAGYSFHNFAIAVDLGLFTAAGKYVENDAPYIALIRACGVPDGFSWGGNWQSFKDYPHFQFSKFGDSSAKIRAIF